MVLISKAKTTCFGLQRPSSGFHNFFAKESHHHLLNLTKPRKWWWDLNITTRFRHLYKTL